MVTNFIIFYFNLKPSINMNLLPSLNDGRLPTASFDMLLDMFLSEFFSGALTCALTHDGECTEPAKYLGRCHFPSGNNRFLA